MSLLLKNATILDPRSPHNGSQTDILIEKGTITKISKKINGNADKVIDATDHLVLPALFDIRCHLNEPGNEHKESIESLCATAAAGGFSGLVTLPATDPPVQNKSAVKYIINRSENELVNLYPLGAATEDLEGNELTEHYDMKLAGAVGFSNANKPYSKSNVLYKILQYARNFSLPVFSHGEDPHMAQGGMVNESNSTIHTGLKYRPSIAEYSRIQQEIEVAKYAESPIHFSHISCAESVDIIRQAKKEGVKVTCDVSILHLVLTDEAVLEFDTNTKVLPPLRTETDRDALKKGILDGTIDAICSDHAPQNLERKQVEFDYAAFGATTLQTFFSNLLRLREEGVNIDELIEKSSHTSREICNLPVITVEEGNEANIAWFHPAEKWTLNKETNVSLSENSPFWGKQLTGSCKGITSGTKTLEF